MKWNLFVRRALGVIGLFRSSTIISRQNCERMKEYTPERTVCTKYRIMGRP